MKRISKWLVAFVLLGSLTIEADLGGWRPSDTYTNGMPIPASDTQIFTLYCNTTPEEFGPPYEVNMPIPFPEYIPTLSELTPVHNDVPGTYWCATTQYSTEYFAESGYSEELDFTVSAQQLGFVPNPPIRQ